MTTETLTTPPVEGVPEGTGSQGSEAAEQSAQQNQETGTAQVESPEQQASSKDEARKPSDYYRERDKYRRRVETLESTVNELRQMLSKPKTAAPSAPQVPEWLNLEQFWKDPTSILLRLKQEAKEEAIKEYESKFPEKIKEFEATKEHERNEQEALELLFPKTSPNSKETLSQRVAKDKARMEKIMEIMDTHKLDEFSKTHPIEAARLVVSLYEQEKAKARPANPNVLPKKLVGGAATGSPSTGGKTMATLNEVRVEREKLEKELENNPDLRYDPTFKQRWDSVKSQYSKLSQEQGKQ